MKGIWEQMNDPNRIKLKGPATIEELTDAIRDMFYGKKIDIIKQIVKHHPGYGTEKGYSWYVGGMRDTGDWKWDVMLDAPIADLKLFLDNLNEQEKRFKERYEQEEAIRKLPKDERDKIYQDRNNAEIQKILERSPQLKPYLEKLMNGKANNI